MTFSDLKKMTPAAAMDLLSNNLQEISDTFYPMLIKGETPDIDQVLDWLSMSSLAATYALSVLQSELDKTGGTELLRPLAHAAIQLYQDAVWMEGPCYGILNDLFPSAYKLAKSTIGSDNEYECEEDVPSELTDSEQEALDALSRQVEQAGLLNEGEELYISVMDMTTDVDLPDGQRLLHYDDKVAACLDVVKKRLVNAGHMGDTMFLVLSAGPSESEANCEGCDGCNGEACVGWNECDGCSGHCADDDAFEMVDLTDLEPPIAKVAKSLMDVLNEAGLLGDDKEASIGYMDTGSAEEDGPAIATFFGRDGKALMILA